MISHGHLKKLTVEKGDSKGEQSTGVGNLPNNQPVTSTCTGLDMAGAALGYCTSQQPQS